MALVAMSCFNPSLSLAQTDQVRAFSPKIKTPNTSSELSSEDRKVSAKADVVEERDAKPLPIQGGSSGGAGPRKLQQHGLGFGLGETFLLGNYAKHGKDKITLDLFYSYAASYSFDLLVNAHLSEHKDNNERVKLKGLNASIKGRFVEYDNLSPYFLGGLGFYAPQAKRGGSTGTEWTDQKVTFGLNFGSGVDLRLNDHYVVGIMGQMHWPFTVQQENQSDLKGYYFKLLVTGMYLF